MGKRLIDADSFELNVQNEWERNEISNGDWILIRQLINEEPTIDAVEVVRGEWIHNPQIGWGETWVCSICGEKTTSSIMGKPRYKYCPMCGANMDGEEAEK